MDESAFGGGTPPGTMSGGNSEFGSGLSFGGGADAPGVDSGTDALPVNARATEGQLGTDTIDVKGFGKGLAKIMGGPDYSAPDPQMSALDQTANTLQQRIQRANSIASNPLLQFFSPEGVQRAREFVPAATEKLQQIKTQQAAIVAGKQQAATLGLAPGEVADEATMADRVEAAKARALRGDLKVFKGLQAVDPKTAEAIQDQVHEVAASHLGKAQYAFDKLSNMRNQGEYTAAVNSLRADGTLTDLEALGLKVPPSFDAFSASKPKEAMALREARIGIDTVRQKLEERNTYQPMEEKEAKTYNGRFTTVHGDQITNGTWGRNASTNARGLIVNGAADPRELGKSFTLGSADQRKAIREEAEGVIPKVELEKARAFDRTYELAKPTAEQAKRGDVINTNPNVQQALAEQLASMLRGGSGGATSGLLNIETSKRGYVQGLLDKVMAGYSGGINTISGKDVRPYMTKLTQTQIREVVDGIKAHNDELMEDRIGPIARRAGALGFDTTAFGWGKDESQGVVSDQIEKGRIEQVERMLPNHQAIGGGDGVFQLGAQRPGAGAVAAPPGTQPMTQLPGAQPLQTPVQQSTQGPGPAPTSPSGGAPPPAVPAPTSPGGGGSPPAPQTIAGQTVNVALPPGASPDYVKRMQRVESGNEKDPWTAKAGNGPDGKPLSSAGGAFQFINSTWAASKPPGAPDSAKAATPQQQAEALATLTTKNAASLQANKLPVNDTTLYMAHNLGAGGAATLLQADPNADARSVVGEQAARNNPTFFKGRPTVAKVLDRYAAEMNAPDDGPKPKPGAGGATAEQPPTFMQRVSRTLSQGVAGDDAAKDKAVAEVGNAAVEHAPAIGSTAGAVVGSAGGPAGTIAGGAAGGGAGQMFKDYMQGREQNPTAIAKEAALGGVLSVASAARPLVAAAARVGGSAAVEGATKAAEGGDAGEVVEAAAKGGGLALGGEALGRFISAAGPAAHKLFSKFTPDAQKELSAQAGKLVEARKVLATEQPKLPGEGAGVNPKFEAAKKAEEDASQYIKDHGQKPDDMAYAYEQTKAGTSAGEAATMRKAEGEKSSIGEGYDKLRQDVRETGVGAPKPNQPMPNGPIAQIRTAENPTGKVPEAFRADAEHAEMLAKAPAKDWAVKWQQLQDAGSELIKKRMAFLANNDKPSAEAMNGLFEGIRNQQKAAAEYVFGKEQGAKVISHLEDLDKRYAKVMKATQGMNYEKMKTTIQGGNTAERRELEANFKEFAKDDPAAIRAFNAMKAGAQGRMGEEAKLMVPVIAGEFAANMSGVPTVGVISAAIGGHRLVSLMKDYMNAKLLGRPVTFKDFAVDAMKAYAATHGVLNAAGSAVQRGIVMQ